MRICIAKIVGLSMIISAWLISLLMARTSLTVLAIYSLLVLLVVLISLWQRSLHHTKWPLTALMACAALFLAYNFITLFWTTIPTLSIYGVWLLSLLPLAFFAYLLLAPSEKMWHGLLVMIVIVLILEAVLAIAQYYGRFNRHGPSGTFINQNLLSSFLHLGLLPLCGLWLTHLSCSKRFRLLFVIALLFYADGLIASRAGLIGFFCALLFLIVIAYGHYHKRHLLSLLLLLLFIFVFAYPPVFNYLSGQLWSIFTNSTPTAFSMASYGHYDPALSDQYRWQVLKACWRLLQDFPLWGIGYAGFTYVFQQYRYTGEYSSGFYAHNDFLHLWIEGGIAAMLLILLMGFLVTWMSWRLRRLPIDTPLKLQTMGVGAAVVAIFVHAMFSFPLYVAPILLIVGLWCGRLQHVFLIHSPHIRRYSVAWLAMIKPKYLHASIILLVLLAITYFASIVLTYQLSLLLEKTNDAQKQQRYSQWMRILQPNYSSSYIFSERVLTANYLKPANVPADLRQAAYQTAMIDLAKAEQLNRWDPLIYREQASVMIYYYRVLPTLVYARVLMLYQKALAVDPRDFYTRYRYAKLLMLKQQRELALLTLFDGLKNKAVINRVFIQYIYLYAQLLKQSGLHNLANHYFTMSANAAKTLRMAK